MDTFTGERERHVAAQAEPLRDFFLRIQPDSSYSPLTTTEQEQQQLVEAYRKNWGRSDHENRALAHFSSFRSSSMIKPKDSRMFLIPQLRYLPTVCHTHDYFEFGLLLEGSCRHFVNNQMLEMTAGDVILIPPGTNHQPVMLTDTCVWYDLGIRADSLEKVLPHIWAENNSLTAFLRSTCDVVSSNACGLFHLDPVFLFDILRLASAVPLKEDHLLLRRKEEMLAELIVAELADSTPMRLTLDDVNDSAIDDDIIRYINGHFRTLTRKKLAEHFSYSERQITRIVQKLTGRSLQQYLCDVRMEYIMDMLAHTMAPVHEIVEAAGYYNNNNFFQLFRERCGMTPGEYRRVKQMGQ